MLTPGRERHPARCACAATSPNPEIAPLNGIDCQRRRGENSSSDSVYSCGGESLDPVLAIQLIHALARVSSSLSNLPAVGESSRKISRCAPASRYCSRTRLGSPWAGKYIEISSLEKSRPASAHIFLSLLSSTASTSGVSPNGAQPSPIATVSLSARSMLGPIPPAPI